MGEGACERQRGTTGQVMTNLLKTGRPLGHARFQPMLAAHGVKARAALPQRSPAKVLRKRGLAPIPMGDNTPESQGGQRENQEPLQSVCHSGCDGSARNTTPLHEEMARLPVW